MNDTAPQIFHFQWSLTEECNLACKHCYRNQALVEEELSTKNKVKVLNKFISQVEDWGLDRRNVHLSFTGGEPLLDRDLFEILKHCKENHDSFIYGLLTNGILIDSEVIDRLKALGVSYVQLSLDGMKKNNDKIRGEGTFEKIVEVAKTLHSSQITTNLSMTVSHLNWKDVPEVINLAKEIGVGIQLKRLVPVGGAKELKDEILSPNEVRTLWHYISEAKGGVWRNVALGCEAGILAQDGPQYTAHKCIAGDVIVQVLPNGDVYPCRRLPIKAGNLLEETLASIYQSDVFRKVRSTDSINEACSHCPYFEKCEGGAKCLSRAYFGNFSAPDPNCWRLFEHLPDPSLEWQGSR